MIRIGNDPDPKLIITDPDPQHWILPHKEVTPTVVWWPADGQQMDGVIPSKEIMTPCRRIIDEQNVPVRYRYLLNEANWNTDRYGNVSGTYFWLII